MNLKHNDPTASILECLQIEKNCYDEVLDLLDEQMQAIQQEDEKSLDAILAKIESVLQTAQQNEGKLEQVVARLSKVEMTEVGKQAGGLRMEVESVLAQIIEMENNCQTELKARKFLAQDKILDLKQRRSLLKGYGTSQQVKPKISKNV